MHEGAPDLPNRTLTLLAPLLGHILTRVGGIRVSHGAPTTPAWEAPLPLNQDAFDDANWLWTVLTETVLRVAGHTGNRPPDISRSVWRNGHGKTVGLPVIDTTGGLEAARTLTRWLTYNATEGELEWLAEAAAEVSPRHPLHDKPHTAQDARCEDDAGTLIVKPPRHHLDESIAVCQTCGRIYDEQALQTATVRWAAVQAAERVHARAQAVIRHLTGKYVDSQDDNA